MVAKTLNPKPEKILKKKQKKEVAPPTTTEDQMEVENEQESVDVGNENMVYVSNLPSVTPRSELANIFAPHGEIKLILLSQTKKGTAEAFVVFDSAAAAKKALKLNGSKFKDHAIQVIKPKDHEARVKERKTEYIVGTSSNTVFVQNINKSTKSHELKKFFSSCGDIHYVKILKNHATNVSKGKAFVCFKETESISAALKLSGEEIDGQNITVEVYNKPEKK